MKGSAAQLKGLYGPGLAETLDQINRENNVASVPTQDESDYPTLGLKHKKRAAVLKQILKDGGYGDLAREVSIHNGR